MTNSRDSKYPTRADLAKANPYTERDKLSEEEREERNRSLMILYFPVTGISNFNSPRDEGSIG